MSTNEVLAALNLPPAVKVQTLKLLARISQAANADELWRASDRADGFLLGLETVRALNPLSLEGLSKLFDQIATTRRQEQTQ